MQPTRTHVGNNCFIDVVGDSFIEVPLSQWPQWLEMHKDQVASMKTKTFNHHVHIVDGADRYRLRRDHGKMILRKCSKDDAIDRHDILNMIAAVERGIKDLTQQLEKKLNKNTNEPEDIAPSSITKLKFKI